MLDENADVVVGVETATATEMAMEMATRTVSMAFAATIPPAMVIVDMETVVNFHILERKEVEMATANEMVGMTMVLS